MTAAKAKNGSAFRRQHHFFAVLASSLSMFRVKP
jgi:hypothetical protein